MLDRIDHEGAAFFAAMLCFWTLCAIGTKWIPQLKVFWEQHPFAAAPFDRPKRVGVAFMWLCWAVLFGRLILRVHWTIADTYKSLIWFGIFALIALLGLSATRLWSWTLLWIRGEERTPEAKT